MIASILAGIGAAPWARAALRYSGTALTIVLFLISIRRSGERVGRLSERLETRDTIVSVRPDCPAADRVGLIVSALGSGHYGVLGGSADEAALDG